VNSRVADEQGLREGDIVAIESVAATIQAAVYPNPATPPEILGIPVGQGHKAFGRYAAGRGSNPLDIVDPRTDEQSGGLAWAATRVRMRPTGERIRIPKMENSVLAIDFDGTVAQITNEG
jgi:molybdopterin-containing oxidoreductase family iron-sulfur binding subunit